MLHASWRLQLGSARHRSRWSSSSNANRQPAARAAPNRRLPYPSRRLVTHSSNDLAGSTSQAAATNPAGDGQGSSPQPAAVSQQQQQQQQQLQQHQPSSTPGTHPASSSTQVTANVATADSTTNRTSTSSNGAAAAAAASSNSSAGDYIIFTADELLQDSPAPSTGGRESSSTASDTRSNEDRSSTSLASDLQPSQQLHQQQEQQQQQRAEVPPLPTHLTVAVGPADEATDEGPFAAVPEQQQPQQQVPPPLIDPDVDIANDPAYAIRLMDILDQIAVDTSSSSNSSGLSSAAPSLDQVCAVLWCAVRGPNAAWLLAPSLHLHAHGSRCGHTSACMLAPRSAA